MLLKPTCKKFNIDHNVKNTSTHGLASTCKKFNIDHNIKKQRNIHDLASNFKKFNVNHNVKNKKKQQVLESTCKKFIINHNIKKTKKHAQIGILEQWLLCVFSTVMWIWRVCLYTASPVRPWWTRLKETVPLQLSCQNQRVRNQTCYVSDQLLLLCEQTVGFLSF